MHRAGELKYKLEELLALAVKTRDASTPPVRMLMLQALCEAGLAMVVAHERGVLPALRSMAWKDVRSDGLVAYASFRQAVAALLLPHADDAEVDARIEALTQTAAALQALGMQSIWPIADLGLDPLIELQLEHALETPDRTCQPADEPPAKQLVEDAAVILSSFPASWRRTPGQGR